MIAIQIKSLWTTLNPVEKIRPLLKHYDLSLRISHLWCNLIVYYDAGVGVERALRDVARARSSCLMAFCPVINMIDLLFKIMAYNTDIVFSLSFTGKCPLFLFLNEKENPIIVANNPLVFTFDWSTSKNCSYKTNMKGNV